MFKQYLSTFIPTPINVPINPFVKSNNDISHLFYPDAISDMESYLTQDTDYPVENYPVESYPVENYPVELSRQQPQQQSQQQPQQDSNTTVAQEYKNIDLSFLKTDIEDLLKSQGITSVNGKKIKFGNSKPRPQNANYGAKNSWHKKVDPLTGKANARDISITGGNAKDYADFRKMLLGNKAVITWMNARKWGIINEITREALRRTRGTGPHFHFGPDKWAVRTWQTWLKNPNISVTQIC